MVSFHMPQAMAEELFDRRLDDRARGVGGRSSLRRGETVQVGSRGI